VIWGVERKAFRDQVDLLNFGFGDGAGMTFIPLGWEDTLASTGRRTQSVINQEIDACDIFLLTLHRRWGQDAPDSEYSSYTEEEFYRAFNRFKETGSPEIFVFFKKIDLASIADPGPQLQKLLNFKLEMEESRSVFYKQFDTDKEFKDLIDCHLRAFCKGNIPSQNLEAFRTPFPIAAREEIKKAEAQLNIAEQRVRAEADKAEKFFHQALAAEELAIELSRTAAELALEGKFETARVKFAKAIQVSSSPEVLKLAAQFYYLNGELDEAEKLLHRGLGLSQLAEEEKSFFSDLLGTIRKTLGMENQLRLSLEQNQLLMHYQPQFNLVSKKLIALEALIRWRHPIYGLLAPASFIPLAEETGMIIPIGRWALEESCRQAKRWHDTGHSARVAVNISGLEFRRTNLAIVIREIINLTGINPEKLELELSESTLMTDVKKSIHTMNEVTDLGVSLVVDNFGTGYSSLIFLKHFPLKRLKIDRSFLKDLDIDGGSSAAVITSILAIGRSLGLEVIAEGIETEKQLEFLVSKGCEFGQGFLLGGPPVENLTGFF
jgi:EAL domain-containing protein (putative c-di-GMP-specific phosphodiesterase class I)